MRAATFTTYINAKEDPGLEQAFARQTRIAQTNYALVTQAALEATRATAGLLGGRGVAGASSGTKQISDRANATREITRAAADAERASIRMASATRKEAQEASGATRANQGLARSLTTTATALNVVQGPLGPLAGRLSAVSRAVTELTGARLGLAAFGATLFAFGRTANSFATIESRLRPLYASQNQVNRALDEVVGIAGRARSALEPVADLYVRLTTAGKDVGISAPRAARITELAAKAATLSGGTAQSQQAGLGQFAQAIGSNNLGGDELRSIKENTFALATAIAAGFKNADGSIGTTIGNLKKLGSEGKLTADVVAEALERSAFRIETSYGRLPLTLTSAGQQFSNSFTVLVGRFDQSIGFTRTLAEALGAVASNLRVVAGLAVGVAGAFAGIKLVGIVRSAAESVAAIQAQQAQVKALDVAWIENAAVTDRAFKSQIVGLEAERQQIRRNILEIEREAAVRQAAAQKAIADQERVAFASAQTVVASRYSGYAVNPGTGVRQNTKTATADLTDQTAKIYTAQARAADVAAASTLKLNNEQARLNSINRELKGTYAASATAARGLETATANVAGRVGLLRGAAGSLLNLLGGPWGIAFAAATTAIYLLATAESAAEAATRKHEDAQRNFASSVDRTTGKVYDQIGALQKLSLQRKSSESAQASVGQFKATGGQIANLLQGLTGRGARPEYATRNGFRVLTQGADRRTPEQRELATALAAFQGGQRGSIPQLQSVLARQDIQRGVPGLSKVVDKLGSLFDTLDQRRVETGQSAAATRVLQGRAREGDLARAFGEEQKTTGGTAKRLSKGELARNAEIDAARSDLERAKAELKKTRADGPQAGESDEQYQARLAGQIKGVRDLQAAEADRRKSARAGAAAEKKEARDALQDAKDRAAATRDAALLQLNQSGLNPKSQEFLEQRIKILKTYDDEVNKLDASKAASSSAASQMIADARAIADAAQKAGEKRNDILASYDEAPKALDRARDQIDDLQRFVDTAVDGAAFIGKTRDEIEAIKKDNPLGTGIYTQEMADGDARRIEAGVRKPLSDIQRDYARGLEISSLLIQGRDNEAEALRQRNQLLDQGITLSNEEYQGLVAQQEQQQRINDALASRQRITSLITGAVDQARDSLESLIVDLPTRGAAAGVDFLKSFQQQFVRIQARQLTERLFAGADEKVRALLTGRSGVDQAIGKFSGTVDNLAQTTTRGETAVDKLATAAENAAKRLDNIQTGSVTGAGAVPAASLVELLGRGNGVTGPNLDGGDIVVTGKRQPTPAPFILPTSVTPSARSVYNTIGQSLFGNLDRLVDKVTGRQTTKAADGTALGGSTFFKKIGDSFGTALEGAGQGAIASGFAKALGLKQSSAGAAIGGAIGNFLPIPGGGFIGGLIGGTIGGLFQKTPKGQAGVSTNQYGELVAGAASGTTSSAKAGAGTLAGAVASGIQSIAESLGAKVTGSTDVQIGTYKDQIRVNDHGGAIGGVKGSGAISFATEQDAINYAIQDAIRDGVLSGISAASQKILASGQDLQKALAKATAIESIPKRLLQLTDPVKYAVQSLNDDFTNLISYLKEGGATAQQFADAQKLYDLERAEAIKQATQQAASAIDQFLKDMVGGSNSPLNKKTTYQNAASDLNAFKADIAAGKVVDQNDLLNAARNYQDASRALYGSSQSFFDDFNMLRTLLEKARDNAGVTDVSTLPPSPFAGDTTVQNAIASLQQSSVGATQQQTDILAGKIDTLISVVKAGSGSSSGDYYGGDYSSVGLLPSFKSYA